MTKEELKLFRARLRKCNKSMLSVKSGVSRRAIYDIIYGTTPEQATYDKLCEALDLLSVEVIRRRKTARAVWLVKNLIKHIEESENWTKDEIKEFIEFNANNFINLNKDRDYRQLNIMGIIYCCFIDKCKDYPELIKYVNEIELEAQNEKYKN